jgi:glycosyltransferase involved in cell wall biosynthesis
MNSEATRVLIVIPTYNNRTTLPEVVRRAVDTGLDVLVVNDGSTDGGPELLSELPVTVIGYGENRGKGAAIKEAGRWAAVHRYTHVITIDADGQHDPAEAGVFLAAVRADPSALVLGKRDFDSPEVPDSSKFGRNFSNFWVKLTSGNNVSDSQSGYRAYPVEILTRIDCRSKRYNFEVEILVRAIWAGYPVHSVEVSVRYSEATRDGSHFDPWRDNVRISLTYARLFLRHIAPIPHKKLHGPTNMRLLKEYFTGPKTLFRMLLQENLSTREIVLACMLGIFLGTLPLIGLHSVAIIFVATRLRLNRLIAFNISHFCAPPVVPALCIEAGHWLRTGGFIVLDQDTVHNIGNNIWGYIGDYLLGSAIMAPVLAGMTGFIVYCIVSVVRIFRRRGDRERHSVG